MAHFRLVSAFEAAGDQPAAIARLCAGLREGQQIQTLLGATGTGKTYTMASIVESLQRPALVLAPNKTLAAQLFAEFKEFFPDNAVEYFVSFYDYYQPEAYVPRSDTYIEKDSTINEEIEKHRLAATRSLLERRDVIVVASVSCIYGIGSAQDYHAAVVELQRGDTRRRDRILRHLNDLHYKRNDASVTRGTFRVRGEVLEIFPAYDDLPLRIEFSGDVVDYIATVDPLTGESLTEHERVAIYPARHFVTPAEHLQQAIVTIEEELRERVAELERTGRKIEAKRISQRTNFDLTMLRETGICLGIENYARHLSGRAEGDTPWTLLDYLPEDGILFVDESHVALPQVRGMYRGDRARKETLVNYGFRLPSALDNRPLTFEEFEKHLHPAIFVSATPTQYELATSAQVVEQLIRPTGLLDPVVEVRPKEHQVLDLVDEIRRNVARGERVLVTTVTKELAESLATYLAEIGIKAQHLHADVETLERIDILRNLRLGVYDVVVGINLLREGLDLPEVSLVAILDADQEGYLRSDTALIQTIGRASRHVDGRVIMYAESVTVAMQRAIDETARRRAIQAAHNEAHGITPTSIQKAIHDLAFQLKRVAERRSASSDEPITNEDIARLILDLERQMKEAASALQFERAALLRDEISGLRGSLADAALAEGIAAAAATRPPRPRRRGGARGPGARAATVR